MSDPRGGNGNGTNGNGNQLGGGMNGGDLGSASLPRPGDDTDQIDTDAGPIDPGQSPIHAMHNYNRAVYDKLTTADRQLGHIRAEMDKLATMGDTVTPEDVIAAAGRIVGHGIPAREIAQILSEMPTQAGQGLAAWISQQDAMVTLQEQEVERVRGIAAHRMSVSAVQAMAMGDVRNQAQRASMGMGALAPGGGQAPPPAMSPQLGASQGGIPEPEMVQMVGQPGGQGQGGGGTS